MDRQPVSNLVRASWVAARDRLKDRITWLEAKLATATAKGWRTEEAADLLANAQHTLGIYEHLLRITPDDGVA